MMPTPAQSEDIQADELAMRLWSLETAPTVSCDQLLEYPGSGAGGFYSIRDMCLNRRMVAVKRM
jgi:hypothetical protein